MKKRTEDFSSRPDLIVDWRPFVMPLLVTLILVITCTWALAQAVSTQPVPTPRDGEFKEMLCRMAVGNVQGHVQDHFGLYVELYAEPDGTMKTDASYGLLTGTYYGGRGVSGHGPTLDEPGSERFLEDGTQFTNADSAHLRSIASEFRQGACDELPTPQS